jgi:hypothetical protein
MSENRTLGVLAPINQLKWVRRFTTSDFSIKRSGDAANAVVIVAESECKEIAQFWRVPAGGRRIRMQAVAGPRPSVTKPLLPVIESLNKFEFIYVMLFASSRQHL